MTIKIREMEFEDFLPVYELGMNLFTAERWPVLYRTWDEYEIIERFVSDKEYCLVAEDKNGLCGFTIGSMIQKPKSSWQYGYIVWLGIKESHQKRGLGKKLYSALKRRFKKAGARILMIDTSMENKAAISFFEKQGFGQNEAHLYMFKKL